MNPFDALRGNEKQKDYFSRQIAAGKLPHAFILEGEEGSGRHTLALAVAAAMAKDEGQTKKIFSRQCPDVREYGLAPEKKTFTVETVRKMKSDAAIKPNDLSFKLFILSSAERMNPQAQNAALKILEEPPQDTYFFLLCESASALLPTVRSRASVIRMERFSSERLEELLLKDPVFAAKKREDPDYFAACLKGAAGCYGRAAALLSGREDSAQKDRANAILAALDPPNRAELLLLCTKLPANRQDFDGVLAHLQQALRDCLVIRSSKDPLPLYFYPEGGQGALSGRLGIDALLRLYDHVEEVRGQVGRNVNMQNARLALFTGLYAIASKG